MSPRQESGFQNGQKLQLKVINHDEIKREAAKTQQPFIQQKPIVDPNLNMLMISFDRAEQITLEIQ